jgi:UDP-3-O-[3-hydroxymyristoyl] glucosamine N-acyltransferase
MVLVEEIHKLIGGEKLGDFSAKINKVATWQDSDENSLIWIKKTYSNCQSVISNNKAIAFIVSENCKGVEIPKGKIVFFVKNPRLAIAMVINKFFIKTSSPGIHQTAFIHPEAVIDPTASIGPFTYIGKTKIGKKTIIKGHTYIYDDIIIGDNVLIHSGAIIGSDGFGFEKDDEGNIFKFPHIGGVIIEDNVEIGANTCIDRGSIGNTIIKEGAKIDNLVHIAHNVEIGNNSFVIANSMVGGSTKIGDNVWVAPSVSLMNGIEIGSDSTIGMAALVTKTIPENETWAGFPAKPMKDFIETQNALKILISNKEETQK